MKIYISIPISGHDIEVQRAKAKKVEEALKARGHEVVNPFDTPYPDEVMSSEEQWRYFMGEDIKRLLACDGVIFCSQWFRSKGCSIEHIVARECKLDRYYDMSNVPVLNMQGIHP